MCDSVCVRVAERESGREKVEEREWQREREMEGHVGSRLFCILHMAGWCHVQMP
jgi:hypothetical protein